MRGSLRIRHVKDCPATAVGRARDARACRCSPSVQARVAGVSRSLGQLPRGWRTDDLIPFERELSDLRGLVLEGRAPRRSKIVTLAEWAEPWFERIAAQVEAGRMSPLTYNQYEGAWRLYLGPALGRLPLPAIDHETIVRFMREHHARGLSESRVQSILIPLSGMLTDAMTEDLIPKNPLRTPRRARHRGGSRHDFIDLQPTRRPPRLLEPHQARSLLAAIPERYVDLALAGLTTGFRRNELLGLRWEWIDWKARRIDLRGQLWWRKTGNGREREPIHRGCKYDSEREVPLWSGLADLLARRQASEGWVFTNPETGMVWREESASDRVLMPAMKASELYRPGHLWHVLRHTYASVLAAGGVRRHELEQLMGHVTPGTTGIYTHLFRESYERVHDALDRVYGGQPAASRGPRRTRVALRRRGRHRPVLNSATPPIFF